MTTVGYSRKPLVEKLGFKPSEQIQLINSPEWYPEELALAGVIPTDAVDCDWLHAFFTDRSSLEAFLSAVDLDKIKNGLWVSWPKKTSKVTTDLTEQTFRDLILPLGWVDTKVAAIDETWSGLKFLRRRT